MTHLQKEYLGAVIIANIGFFAFWFTIWSNGLSIEPLWIDELIFGLMNFSLIVIGWLIGVTDIKHSKKG